MTYNIALNMFVCPSCKGLELLAAQSETQDASCLPALRVSDVEPTIPVTAVQTGSAGTAPCPIKVHVHTASSVSACV